MGEHAARQETPTYVSEKHDASNYNGNSRTQ